MNERQFLGKYNGHFVSEPFGQPTLKEVEYTHKPLQAEGEVPVPPDDVVEVHRSTTLYAYDEQLY